MGNETTNFPHPPYQAGSSLQDATAPPMSLPESAATLQHGYMQGPPPPGGVYMAPPGSQMPPPQPETAIPMSTQPPSPPPPLPPPHPAPYPGPAATEPELRKPAPEKIVVGIVTGILSLLVIGLTYAAFLAPNNIIPNPEGPLSSSVIFTVVALLSGIWLCFHRNTPCALGGLVPVIFSITAGSLLVLYFGAVQSFKDGSLPPDINYRAVLTSAGVFGGMAFGALITYAIFAHN